MGGRRWALGCGGGTPILRLLFSSGLDDKRTQNCSRLFKFSLLLPVPIWSKFGS